jgi:hypothetical protein
MPDVLETPRLILCPLRLEDAVRTQEIFPRWEIVRYLNAIVPWPYSHSRPIHRVLTKPNSSLIGSRGYNRHGGAM